MEELTSEKLKETLLKKNNLDEMYLKYIINNNNISPELKNQWNMFISNDYFLEQK